jgi:hypothetical protein
MSPDSFVTFLPDRSLVVSPATRAPDRGRYVLVESQRGRAGHESIRVVAPGFVVTRPLHRLLVVLLEETVREAGRS